MEEENKNLQERATPIETPEVVQTITTPKKKSSLQLIIIILIFMLFIFGLGFYLGKMLYEKECKCNCNKQNEDTETTNNKLDTFDLSNYDSSKVINGSPEVAYGDKVSEVSSSLAMQDKELVGTKISDDKRTVNVKLNWEKFKEMYPNLDETSVLDYNISFNKNVRKVYVNGWGQGWGSETIFYLMEDGTIEYTPVTVKLLHNLATVSSFDLKSYGAIPGAEGVVILATGDTYPTNSPVGGAQTILGFKSTGEFYDLPRMIPKTDAYY